MIYVAQGHNTANLEPIAVTLKIEKPIEYEKITTSDGITRNRGGASAVLHAAALSYDEAVQLLDQFGISLETPSAECTVVLPDYHRMPIPYYGYVTLNIADSIASWWTNWRLEFSNLRRA